ncbi:hypothetical protein AGMMS49982_24400 [Bacteroidia bacterium]|nr:hypothetical protein AGMMS49982_24400 [Bacteroidia bacterium]
MATKVKFSLWTASLMLSAVFVFCISFTGGSHRDYGNYTPLFMDRAALEQSVSYQDTGRELENPGKIYYSSPHIFINERYKGVHVINNYDPYHPVKAGFIVAPGCIDMAVKGNIIYLDNAVDLVAFDLAAKQVTKRIKEVFPEPQSPENIIYYEAHEGYILVGWKEKNTNKR